VGAEDDHVNKDLLSIVSGRVGDGGRDFSVQLDNWTPLSPFLSANEFVNAAQSISKRGEQLLRESDEFREWILDAQSAAERQLAENVNRLSSRQASRKKLSMGDESEALKIEKKVGTAIRRGIESPLLVLDSVSAVFVSNKNPFAR
jgi:hypothetical protein